MGNRLFPYSKTKDADQLRGGRAADQRLCFRSTDSTIPLPSKSEKKPLAIFVVCVGPGRKPRRQVSEDAAHIWVQAYEAYNLLDKDISY